MTSKSEKTLPIKIHEEIFRLCHVDDEPLLAQLQIRLQSCKTVFEQMNCFGLLKQEIRTVPVFSIIFRRFGF